MSRAVVFSGPDHPLEIRDFPTLKPQGSEILVRILCCTICKSDLHTHAGRRVEPMPTVLGHEIVGTIEAFGPDAPRVDAQGTPVTTGSRISWAIVVGCGHCFFCEDDLPQKCENLYKYGHQRFTSESPPCGGLAETIVLTPGTAFFQVPETVSNWVAAPANCATATVAAVLRHAGTLAGRSVLILGAGMLGVTGCAMARALGAGMVMVSDPQTDNLQRAQQFGATHLFSAETNTLAEQVADATEGRGADVVVELAGVTASVEAGLSLARIGGTVVLAGTVLPLGEMPFNPEKVVRRMLTIRGVHNYHPSDLANALAFLADAGRAYPFDSLIAAEYPLDQVTEAFASAHQQPGLRVAVLP